MFTKFFKEWMEHKQKQQKDIYTKRIKDIYTKRKKELIEEKFNKDIQDPIAKKSVILDINLETDELEKKLREEFNENFQTWQSKNKEVPTTKWFDETMEKLKKEPKLNAQINNQEQPDTDNSKYYELIKKKYDENFKTWQENHQGEGAAEWFREIKPELEKEPKLNAQINNQEQQVEDITNKYNNKKSNNLGYRSKYEEDNKQNTSNDISNFNKNKNQNYRYNRDNNNLNQNKYIENNNVNSSKILVGNNVLKDATYISKYENDNNESDSNNKNKNIFVKSPEEQDTKDAIDYINREMPEEYELKSNSKFISVNNHHLVEPKYCDNNGIPVEDNYGTLYSNKKKNNFEDFINNNDIEKKNHNNLSNDNSRNNIVNENVDLLNFTFGKEEEKPSILDKQNELRETGTFAYDNKNNIEINKIINDIKETSRKSDEIATHLPYAIQEDEYNEDNYLTKIRNKNNERLANITNFENNITNKLELANNPNINTQEYIKYLDDTHKNMLDLHKDLDDWCNRNPYYKQDKSSLFENNAHNTSNYQYQYSNPIRNKYHYTPYNSYNYTPYRKRYDNYELPKLNYNYDNISDLMDNNSYKLQLNFDYSKPYQSQGRRYNLHTYRYRPYLRYGY